jgi:hypothetical protein
LHMIPQRRAHREGEAVAVKAWRRYRAEFEEICRDWVLVEFFTLLESNK